MIDLRNCKPNAKLLTSHGTVITYLGSTPEGHYYDHFVRYPDGSLGTRTHDGHVFRKNLLPDDDDIVAILTENEALARQQMQK